MKRTLITPEYLDRTTAPINLSPSRARFLQRADTTLAKGRIIRKNGVARTQVQPSSTTVTSSGVARGPDGSYMTLTGNTGGDILLTPGDNAMAENRPADGQFPPSGPTNIWGDPPRLEDRGNDNGGCCQCVDDLCGGLDIDVSVTSSPGCVVNGPYSLTGERLVGPCVGAACAGKYWPRASVNARVSNTSGKCVYIQFKFTVTGLPNGCSLKIVFNGGGETSYSNGSAQSWFYQYGGNGFSNTLCMQMRVDGTAAAACGARVRVNGWTYTYQCFDASGCNPPSVSPAIDPTGCPAC